MKFSKTKAERKIRRSFWFKNEWMVAWVALIITMLVIYPAVENKAIFEDFSVAYLIPLAMVMGFALIVAFLIALTQVSRLTLKDKEASFQQNFSKVASFVVVIILVSLFLLSEQMNFFDPDFVHPPEDIDFLGRQFDFGGSRQDGYRMFKTLACGALVYIGLSGLNLWRILKK